MSKRSTAMAVGTVCALLLGGCVAARVQGPSATTSPQDPAAAPATTSPATNGSAATAAAPSTPEETAQGSAVGAFAGCAAKLDEGPTRELTVAGRKAKQTGARLKFLEADADGQLVLGVLGPVNEDSGINLMALRKYLAFFAEEKVEALVVTGDVGETANGIRRVLEELSASKLPILVISGNRECKEDFADGVAQAQAKFDGIVNLNAFRAVELGGLTFVSLPGHYDPNFITCETGCRYDRRTLDDVVTLAKQATTPVVLVSHGPPRGASSQSLDYAAGPGNAGDPEVNRVLQEGKIPFGLFSNIKEAGARATASDLATQVPEQKDARSLLLNPGPADTTRWEMNDGTFSFGNAAIFTFKGGTARWKAFRAQKPTAEEKKAAKAMDPPKAPKKKTGGKK